MIDCSIIIPVYNAETTLSQTLDSILCSETDRIEVLLVNDGSTDNSGKLCALYAEKDTRVKVIHKENGGVSSARNLGMQNATGRYLYFPDSDDIVHISVLLQMLDVAIEKKVDVVIANYETEDIATGQVVLHSSKIAPDAVYNRESITQTILKRFYLGDNFGLSSLWNKIYPTNVIKRHGITFDEKRVHGEDWAFNIGFFQIAETLVALNETLYTYRLDGTQNYNKYKKNLGYALSNGYDIVCGLNERYQFATANSFEDVSVALKFYGQVLIFLKMQGVSKDEKKHFIRTKAVKQAMSKIYNIKTKTLSSFGLSKRDKVIARFVRWGFIKIPLIY